MRTWLCALVLVMGGYSLAQAAVIGKDVAYTSGDTTLKGYIAYDDQIKGQRPGILVVHEWWGHNAYARKRADMLAELGYVAMAIDMYGDGKSADHPDNASAFMQAAISNEAAYKARFMAAYDQIKSFAMTDPKNIGAIGYCFGGATVLKMALWGTDLKGVVSFHGSLLPPKDLAKDIKARILVCHGGDDSFITPEQVSSFKDVLNQSGARYQFNVYEGAKHSFTNPDADAFAKKFNMGVAYDKAADEKSWQDMKTFFNEVFGAK